MKEKLQEIVSWLDDNYNQDSENYSIFQGPKPAIVKYDEHTAISFWGCGAIVCIKSLLYFIEEDDGNWLIEENERDYGLQSCFSVGWAKGFANALDRLVEYTKENGEPVYFSGTKNICHYTL
jgi:hypothetical protein